MRGSDFLCSREQPRRNQLYFYFAFCMAPGTSKLDNMSNSGFGAVLGFVGCSNPAHLLLVEQLGCSVPRQGRVEWAKGDASQAPWAHLGCGGAADGWSFSEEEVGVTAEGF